MRFFIKYVFVFLLVVSCKSTSIIDHDSESIVYEGRIGVNDDKKASEIYWSGSSIKINFEGAELKAVLEDENGLNYFNVILDGKPIEVLKLDKGKKTYVLVKGIVDKKHTIELTKRNEWTYGKTLFYGFEVTGKALEADAEKSIFIEYYGDSITVGHGNEDTLSGQDRNDGDVTNNYMSYSAITARRLNANYSCIARSGIGITVSWFNMIMPEMYYRLDPSDAGSKWDFSKKQADIVVVNLFQNDSWIVKQPKHEEYVRRFGEETPNETKIISAYSNFVGKIRSHYPKASIVCLLGNMDITKANSPWPNYVTNAVKNLKDTNIYTCFVPYKKTKKHPRVGDHKIIADRLTKLIKTQILKN